MFRLFFPLLFLCALFAACSSDDSASLNDWFGNQNIAISYKEKPVEVEVVVDSVLTYFDSSTYIVTTFAVLGKVNNLEHTLYFGLEKEGSIESPLRLKIDKIFYEEFSEKKLPSEIRAIVYWLSEPDTSWQKLDNSWESGDYWNSYETSLVIKGDTIVEISLPDALKNNLKSAGLLIGLELQEEGEVLRLIPPSGTMLVKQKTKKTIESNKCLFSGTADSLRMVFNFQSIAEKAKLQHGKTQHDKTVVFAQLAMQMPSEENMEESELGYPVPLYVFNEEYRVNSDFVRKNGHPNLLFRPQANSDSLILQVTRRMRNYANADTVSETLDFILGFGNPMLKPDTLIFFNPYYGPKVFASRPAYAKYDFSYFVGKKAKLRLWLADYDDKK